MHVQLDPIGGVAGDMFLAALLDAFPEHEATVQAAIRAVGLDHELSCRLVPHRDAVLSGSRFVVEEHGHAHHHDHDHHPHVAWSEIRSLIERSDLAAETRRHAVGIFALLAAAEARVHGIEPEAVTFHEVGAADSIADIVGAASLVTALGARHWSIAPLPLGSGRIRTAHGVLPIPAPATALLLEGFATIDDGVPGERVTPTGAAIIRYLCADAPRAAGPRTILRSGLGFGTRKLDGLSNCLRVLVFEDAQPAATPDHRELGVIEFEVDDQSAEDLALGLDRLRAHPAVLDAVQMPVFGKKGRMMTHVRLLTRPEGLEEAAQACFEETTTIGLRLAVVRGYALQRQSATIEVDGREVRVKTVERPRGRTAKAEADDLAAAQGHDTRARLRRAAERLALEEAPE